MSQTKHASDTHSHDDDHPHVVPLSTLVTIFASLLVLTVITVAVRYVDIGEFNLALALLIATVKATLVVLYFMHLRWDSYFNSISLIAAIMFVALFIGISLTDTAEYAPNVQAFQMTSRAEEPLTPMPAAATPPEPIDAPAPTP